MLPLYAASRCVEELTNIPFLDWDHVCATAEDSLFRDRSFAHHDTVDIRLEDAEKPSIPDIPPQIPPRVSVEFVIN